ncbi:MAG: topoisomerase C-terminal repeat-containing protein [SAR324 cluster bacterium]|nr:topoisomerase C-terminal repeat-containing protein [SAR324 cluster bacterium]
MNFLPLGSCPQCKVGFIIQGNFAWNCHRWKEGCDFKIKPVIAKKNLSPSHIKQLLKKGKTRLIKNFQGKNGLFDARLQLTDEHQIEFIFEEDPAILGLCPQCEQGSVVKRPAFYECDQKDGCEFKIWKTLASKNIKDKDVKALLKHGKTPIIKGFRGRYGKFNAALSLNDQGEVVFDYEKQ